MNERMLSPITSSDEEWCRARYDDMFALANRLHGKQTDRAGVSYIVHLHYVSVRQGSYAGRVIALLHDSIEDNCVTAMQLRNLGMPESIIERVEALAKKEDETYEAYVARVIIDQTMRLVKRADLEHNMTLTRLKIITARDLERMQKYHRAYALIQEYGHVR
ncbi:GTP pyrophosphokinase [Xanthomonas phage RTH11]|nr:GTP pyrophosphokinase [Xanthomonas phage RTH11]